MWWEAHGNSKEMRNESGREEEKSPNMKHCFLSGRAWARINCQWSHFWAMSVYLYWLWTDHLAGASCSEAQRASWFWLTREEPCNDTGFMYSATAGIWFGESSQSPVVDVKDTGLSLLVLSLSNWLRLKDNAACIQSIGGHNICCCGLYRRNEADQSLTK